MIYFDNAATSRHLDERVKAAALDALSPSANPTRSGHAASLLALGRVEAAREAVLAVVGGERAQCVFTGGCTAALNLALFGTARRGHIVATVTEHNSVLRPLHALRERGIAVTLLAPEENGAIPASAVLRALRRDTYLVCINHASNVTGCVQDLASICAVCRPRGILTLADGAQSVGHVPVAFDRWGLDLLAVAPHKGLHAMMGVGALIVSERVRISPIVLGGTGTDSLNLAPEVTLPDGLEAGTLPYPAIAALGAAARLASEQGLDGSHNLALTARLVDGLQALDGVTVYSRPNPVGVVSFAHRTMTPATLADECNRREIFVRAGHHCAPLMHDALGTLATGTVRVSVGRDNTPDEVEEFLLAMREIFARSEGERT